MAEQWTAAQVREDWDRARRRALWSAVVDVLTRRPGALVPLEEVKTRLNVRGSHYRGLQSVPLSKIVGSEGRYADFDRRFLPRRTTTAERWMSIDNAQYRDVNLPPVELYKIGDIYFVKDGNHRVSVARQRGQTDIDAFVTEYLVDVPLDASLSLPDLLIKEEYSDFLDWTQLARLRPDQRIELTALGGYLNLINHINTHRYYLALERNAPVPAEEAVTSWYDNVYLPVVEAIRKHNILESFPGRTEADLYLWIMQHRHTMLEREGVDPGPEIATLDYVAHHGRRSILSTVSDAAQTLAHAARTIARREEAPSLEMLDFVNWSKIDVACPGVDIRVSDPTAYARLRKHIEDHRHMLGEHWQREVSLEEAVGDWCREVFSPMVAALQEHEVLEDWPEHTPADLYLEAMDHWHEMKQQGTDGGPREAASRVRSRVKHARSWLSPVTGAFRRLVGRRRPE